MKKVREPKDKNRIIAPIDFNPHLPKVSKVFQKHHSAKLFSAPHLGKLQTTKQLEEVNL